ncbi:MAG: hypothetical protein COB83_04275 [Gammaproteobacteria bacterium]|nr:MAG: hypothetical protein COB83_04275 [Gammaproteobacteria bacterium]
MGCSGECAPAFSKKLHPCSVLIEINNAAYKPFKLALRGPLRKLCTSLHLFLREQPLIKKCALIMNYSVVLKQTF